MKIKNHNLTIIENGRIDTYVLDNRLSWQLGRPSVDIMPDIKLHTSTVSRKHGVFENVDGIWFYTDYHGKNGTLYNNRYLEKAENGRLFPMVLSDGDIFVFGGGKKTVLNGSTVWAMFSTDYFGDAWHVEVTGKATTLTFHSNQERIKIKNPSKGTVLRRHGGMAICMGNVTYIIGDLQLVDWY